MASSTENRKPVLNTTKHERIAALMTLLESTFQEEKCNPSDQFTALVELKGFTRVKEDSYILFNQRNLRILCHVGFDSQSLAPSHEALKCIANILLHEPKTRQIFVDLGYAAKAAERLKNNSREDELLNSRILFLITYKTNLDFDALFDQKSLAENINMNIARHSDWLAQSSQGTSLPPIETQALSETLKLLFNLTQMYPHRIATFSESIPHILRILSLIPLPSPSLQPPITYLINPLLNLPLESNVSENTSSSHIFPLSDENRNVDRLIYILDASVRQGKDEELENSATPILTLLRKLYVIAPVSVQKHLQASLLPSNDERTQPLGRSNTLAARLLQLSTSPVASSLRETVSSLLFELSDQDPTTFVRNVGYGFASGFLMTHNLVISKDASGGRGQKVMGDDLAEKITCVDGQEINPITGQRVDMEPVASGPEMTDEEKEREAEKLFVLFERLKATGVVDIVNPVEQVVREGRFQELG